MDFLLFPYQHKSPLALVKNQDGFYNTLILLKIRLSGPFFTICAFISALALPPFKFYIFNKKSFYATKLQYNILNRL